MGTTSPHEKHFAPMPAPAPAQGSLSDRSSDRGICLDDTEIEKFYGSSTTHAYRLKSELVGKCLEEIGMGRFQWKLFVVTGFGWIVDNVRSCPRGWQQLTDISNASSHPKVWAVFNLPSRWNSPISRRSAIARLRTMSASSWARRSGASPVI